MWSLLTATFHDWYEDRAQRLGAALAYYTIFALTPGLIIVMALAGFLLGPGGEGQIVEQFRELIGKQGADAVAATIQSARKETLGATGTALALIPLVFGLWGVFGELQDGLNTIWGVMPKPGRRIRHVVKERFLSFAMVVGIGFLLLVSLVLSAWLAAVSAYVGTLLPAPTPVLEGVNFVISFAVITGSFAMIFKLLPDVKVAWRDVWLGAPPSPRSSSPSASSSSASTLAGAPWPRPTAPRARSSSSWCGSTTRPRSSSSARSSPRCGPGAGDPASCRRRRRCP